MKSGLDYKSKQKSASRPANAVVTSKLSINPADDRYEQEADAMAERVVAGRGGAWQGGSEEAGAGQDGAGAARVPPTGSLIARSIQRKCAECEKEEEDKKKGKLMRKGDGGGLTTALGMAASTGMAASARLTAQLDRSRGGGNPLPGSTRRFMERAFSADFSSVRVHTDGEAGEMSRSIRARAFTHGRDIYFNGGQYAPESAGGQKLLAHELTHVLQQGGSNGLLQRDLATPLPAEKEEKIRDLTKEEIDGAIRYNKRRYNAKNTRLIQQLLGGPVTGEWSAPNIVAIANTQQQYGLKKSGKVDHETFKFLDREQQLEGRPTDTKNCLVSFTILGPAPQEFDWKDENHPRVKSHFSMLAEFSERCDCKEFEYRQYIKGFSNRTRDGKVKKDLTPDYQEDTEPPDKRAKHYGHRKGEKSEGYNHYIDDDDDPARLTGCRFEGNDHPEWAPYCLPGDRFDILMQFRGDILRNGKAIQQRTWTAIDVKNWRPKGDK